MHLEFRWKTGLTFKGPETAAGRTYSRLLKIQTPRTAAQLLTCLYIMGFILSISQREIKLPDSLWSRNPSFCPYLGISHGLHFRIGAGRGCGGVAVDTPSDHLDLGVVKGGEDDPRPVRRAPEGVVRLQDVLCSKENTSYFQVISGCKKIWSLLRGSSSLISWNEDRHLW